MLPITELYALAKPTPHPDVREIVLENYKKAVNLIAELSAETRTLIIDLHKSLLPGDTRCKHFFT